MTKTTTEEASGRPRAERRAWGAAAALYVACTIVYCWPMLREIGAVLPSDTGDPALNTWILWWNAHALPLTARWWSAPMFFPAAGTFALSETLLSLAPISTPLLWAGVSPIAVYNLLFVLSFPTAALAAHALAHRLTGRHDAALLAGLAFGFSPYRAAQMAHLQMQVTCWMPLCLLALHRYLDERRPRHLVLAGVCWLLNGLTSGYLLVFFAVLLGLWVLWFVRSIGDLVRIGGALVLASLPMAPLLAGYSHWQSALGASRSLGEIETFSADASAIWAASPRSWLPQHWTLPPGPEGELYPGAIVLGLTLVGAFVAWRRTKGGNLRSLRLTLAVAGIVTAVLAFAAAYTGGWQVVVAGVTVSMTRPFKVMTTAVWLAGAAFLLDRRFVDGWRRRSAFLFYALAAAATFILALGPLARAFGFRFWYAAPYYWLTQLPGGGTLRVPARFAMLMALCLAQTAAIVFARSTTRGRAAVAAAVLAAGIAVEGLADMPTARPEPDLDLSALDRKAVVLEMPATGIYDETAALMHAMTHGRRLVNGYSGYDPPHYFLFTEALKDHDASVIEILQRYAPVLVVIAKDGDADGKYGDMVRQILGAELVRTVPQGAIYHLPMRPVPVTDVGARLPIAGLSVTENSATAKYMTDGALDTRWEGPSDGTLGVMTVRLERPSTITRIELDLGEWRLDYPRKLRIDVAAAGEPPTTVWEGRTAGLAIASALEDFHRMPLAIDLPAGTRGQTIVLTQLEEHKELSWSVAEMRVYGR